MISREKSAPLPVRERRRCREERGREERGGKV